MVKKPKTRAVDRVTGEVTEEQLDLPFVRHPLARPKHVTPFEGESMTHQGHAESCDINRIMKQYSRSGDLPPPDPRRLPQYGDVTELQAKDLTQHIEESRAAQKVLASAQDKKRKKDAEETKKLIEEAKAARKLAENADKAAAASSGGALAPTPATPTAG